MRNVRNGGGLEFAVLGPMEVRYKGSEVPVRGWREQRVLASLLLAAGRVASVDRLVETLWEDDPPAAAAKAVRNCVSALRGRFAEAGVPAAELGSVLSTEPAGYRLRLDGGYLDAEDFRCRVREAERAAGGGRREEAVAMLRDALALWRGPALDGLGGAVIESGAASLNEQRVTALEQCLELELQLGRDRELIGELRALVSEHPLRERLAGRLMLALYRAGRQAEALEVYRQLAARLAEGLGIDPTAELARLHEAILRQDPSLNAPAPAAEGGDAGNGAGARDGAGTGTGEGAGRDAGLAGAGQSGGPPAPAGPPGGAGLPGGAALPGGNGQRRLRGWRVVLSAACVLAAIAVTGAYLAWPPARPRTTPAAGPRVVTPARDNTDPFADGCKPDQKAIDFERVNWPGNGQPYGTLILFYSPSCQAVWGYLNGPNSTAWTVHIIPVRPADHMSVPWQYSGDAAAGSWSNVLSTRTGCVYIEAFVSTKTRGAGPRAKTACFTATGPEVRQAA